jgi:hypothetical protein
MELNQTSTKTIHQVSAEQNGWKLNATVTVQNGKVINIDGNAKQGEVNEFAPYNEPTSFYGRMEGETLRMTYNFKHEDSAVCDILKAMVDAIIARYEV